MHRLVGHLHERRARVGVRIDRDGRNTHAPRGLDDAAGDFAAVGDQDFLEHLLSFLSLYGVVILITRAITVFCCTKILFSRSAVVVADCVAAMSAVAGHSAASIRIGSSLSIGRSEERRYGKGVVS